MMTRRIHIEYKAVYDLLGIHDSTTVVTDGIWSTMNNIIRRTFSVGI